MMSRPSARHAYVEAEVITGLAHQIRVVRQQRGWTQRDLAKRLGTTQAAVSRLEDPSYGRISLKSLFDLSRVFDAGLQVKFVSMVKMLRDTWRPQPAALEVPSFEDEAPMVRFHQSDGDTSVTYVSRVTNPVEIASFHVEPGLVFIPAMTFSLPVYPGQPNSAGFVTTIGQAQPVVQAFRTEETND